MEASYAADPSVPACAGTCGQPIYHTIGSTTNTTNVTTNSVTNISSGLWLVRFSGTPNLSNIHKRDRFRDGAATPMNWNIISVDDQNDQIIVGNQEANAGSPSDLETNQPSAGPWYTSLFAWEAAEDRDLTSTSRYSNGEIEMAECWPTLDTTAVVIDGWVTAQDNFIKVYTPLNQRHGGTWTDDKYRLMVAGAAIQIADANVKIDGLQIQVSASTGGSMHGIYLNQQQGSVISNNIIKGLFSDIAVGGAGILLYSGSALVINNLVFDYFYPADDNLYAIRSIISGEYDVYNNSLVDCFRGILVSAGNVVAKNNLSTCQAGYCFGGTFVAGSDYNASSDTTHTGGEHDRISQAFSFISTSTDDFHLSADDTCARGHGTSLPCQGEGWGGVSCAADIDGQTRPSNNWDIGADQTITNHANKFKIELPARRDSPAGRLYQPRFLIQDFYSQSGKRGSEEEFITFYDPMDNNSAIYQDKISGSNIYESGTTTVRFGYKGPGTYFDGTGGHYKISTSSAIINPNKGSINLWFQMGFDPNTDTGDYTLINLTDGSSDNTIDVYFLPGGDRFHANFNKSGESTLYLQSNDNSTDVMRPNEWYNMHLAWDSEKDFASFNISGIDMGEALARKWNFDYPDNMFMENRIGEAWWGGWNWKGMIDEVKIYSEAILPFGAFYTGFEENNDYAHADPSLLFYWDAETANANLPSGKIPTANGAISLSDEKNITGAKTLKVESSCDNYSFTANNGDIIDKNQGSVGFWVFPTGAAQNNYFRFYIDSSNFMAIMHTNPSDHTIWVRWDYGGSSVYANGTAGDLKINAWNWIKVTWDTTAGELKLFINGRQSGSTAAIGAMTGAVASVDIGDGTCDWTSTTYLDQIFITNNPASQEISTAFGRPLNIPLLTVNNVKQSYGFDYAVSFTPDPSSVIMQYFKDVDAASVFEVGAGEGYAQVKNLKGGVRLRGGVRF
jgi:hypothetical protein